MVSGGRVHQAALPLIHRGGVIDLFGQRAVGNVLEQDIRHLRIGKLHKVGELVPAGRDHHFGVDHIGAVQVEVDAAVTGEVGVIWHRSLKYAVLTLCHLHPADTVVTADYRIHFPALRRVVAQDQIPVFQHFAVCAHRIAGEGIGGAEVHAVCHAQPQGGPSGEGDR